MLNLKNVDAVIQTIESCPNWSLIEISFNSSRQVAVETRYLARFGVVGVLPIATYRNGDQLALRAVPGQPVLNWPVVRVSHIGEGCKSVCSRVSRLIPALLQSDKPLQHQQALKAFQDSILTYSNWLGDTEGITQGFLNQLRDDSVDMFTPLPHLPVSIADPDSVLALFDSLYERALNEQTPPADLWRQLIQFDSSFTPAQNMLLKAVLASGDEAASRQTAWDVLMLNQAIDNIYIDERSRHQQLGWSSDNPLFIAAQTLLEHGLPAGAESLADIFTPVIEALVNDDEAYDGAAHLQAARQLHAQKQYASAFVACQNALYWRNMAQESTYPEALAFALTIASAWRQPDLIRTLELAQELPTAPARTDTPAPVSEVVLPREVEWTSEQKSILDKLSIADVAIISGDTILIYRHHRWHWLTQSYLGQTKCILTMAVLNMHKLANLIGNSPPGVQESQITPVADLPEDLQQDLHFKLLPEVDDYHYLLEKKCISISGGATTEDTVSPQLTLENRRALVEAIVKNGRGGWFKFWATWEEIEQTLNERN